MSGNGSLRILLVDDDKDLLDLLAYNFGKEDFLVKTVSKIEKAIPAVKKFKPDLIVLDLMMPDGNGIDLCKEIRSIGAFRDVYIFILTARSENYFRDAALETGADEFIEKLSGIRALTSKVRAVLKNRFIIKKGVSLLSAGDLLLNKRLEVAYFRNQQLSLSKPEFEILFFLMQNPDKLISRKSLANMIWGSEVYVVHSSIQHHIESLQRKVGMQCIETIHRDHYRFNSSLGNSSSFVQASSE
ncbi:MAG: response regulator transcription factor [Chryseosolibacter sp.]